MPPATTPRPKPKDEKEEAHVSCNSKKKKKEKKEKEKKKKSGSSSTAAADDVGTCVFPTSRVRRLIAAEADDSCRIGNEAVFVINKASEMFLRMFAGDAYNANALSRNKTLDYPHLSSVVSSNKRYEFLSDFVPERVRAEDALKERLVFEA